MTQTPEASGLRPKPLTMSAASDTIGAVMSAKPGPVMLHQYWDVDPPKQIQKLFRHNGRLCRKWGMRHEIWDRARAEAFLAEHAPAHLETFRRCPHPAMASDLLRLCIVAHWGGLYLDADMGLNPQGGAQLPGLLHEVLLLKWNEAQRRNAPNWCFGFRAGHPMLRHILERTAENLSRALDEDADAALRGILHVSGPGRFTLAAAEWLDQNGCPPGLLVLDVARTGSLVLNGTQILKAPMAYKATPKHWLIAARATGGLLDDDRADQPAIASGQGGDR